MSVLLILCIFFSGCANQESKQMTKNNTYQQKRKSMVEKQIKNRGVKDQKVLNAMSAVPRHEFVPEDQKSAAYMDSPLPIGFGQTISQPYIVAYMTEKLDLTGNEKILEIGTGSGYQAAVLAEIVDSVFTIEIVEGLARSAAQNLKNLGYDNIKVRSGDGYEGWQENAPYDAIIITAAPPRIPKPLINQLKTGGKLIAPVGDYFQELILITKEEKNKIKKKSLLPVRFVPMTGKIQKN